MERMPGGFAVAAGFFGAMGAVFGKLAFGQFSFANEPEALAALIFFIISNVMMWWAYSQSLSRSQSTLRSLMLNMGTNFVMSGITGSLLFGEEHSLLWWMGLSLVICGVSVLVSADKSKNE